MREALHGLCVTLLGIGMALLKLRDTILREVVYSTVASVMAAVPSARAPLQKANWALQDISMVL